MVITQESQNFPVFLCRPLSVAASSAKSAGMVAQTNAFTAAKLRGALLTKINGMAAAMLVEFGSYSSLPDVKTNQRSMHGIAVMPKACARGVSDRPAGLRARGRVAVLSKVPLQRRPQDPAGSARLRA